MFAKLSLFLLLLPLAIADEHNQDWDLAVVVDDRIELLLSNGSLVGSAYHQFSKLKALTFDNIRHQFIVSDMDQMNDTIFTVQLTKETDIKPIIEDLPDDVQGLAIDPLTDILYWTDSINRTINYLDLNDTSGESKVLFAFTDEEPRDVVVDVCRRYIYWTNSNINKPTIERASLDDLKREILIDSDLHKPSGVAIDYNSQRLYWADIREGIYYRIESTNLDGKEREVAYMGTHSKPFGVAVDDRAIYWTDVNNNALWRILKYRDNSVPERLRDYEEKPMGIFAKKMPDCKNVAQAVKQYNESTVEIKKVQSDVASLEKPANCLNGGQFIDNNCKCQAGSIGKYCEIRVCYNFCVRGDCYLSSLGYPQCHCATGYSGKRCERDTCDEFCLNGGRCSYGPPGAKFPKCSCKEGYVGARCETSVQVVDICKMFCLDKDDDELFTEIDQYVCKCNRGTFTITRANATAAYLLSRESQEFESYSTLFQDPAFLVLSCIMMVMLIIIIILSVCNCRMRRRPRIKKRFIVNQNVTPLTYRPQPTTEQCEITIENCCNMNVCETPCFEPPQFRGLQAKNDDKKTLLSNMENGEEVY